jgi:hypothetical protein
MLDIDELRRTRLAPLIDQALEHRAPDPGYFAVMGHHVDIAEAVYRYHLLTFSTGTFSAAFKETVRVGMGRRAECNY